MPKKPVAPEGTALRRRLRQIAVICFAASGLLYMIGLLTFLPSLQESSTTRGLMVAAYGLLGASTGSWLLSRRF